MSAGQIFPKQPCVGSLKLHSVGSFCLVIGNTMCVLSLVIGL